MTILPIRAVFFSVNAAQALGLPFVSPYLQSIGSDFRHGANFATLASTVRLPQTSLFVSGVSPFSLAIQLNQMKQFKARVDELHSLGIAKHFTIFLPSFFIQNFMQKTCLRIIYVVLFFFCRKSREAPFTGRFREIALHVLHRAKRLHRELSISRHKRCEAVST